MPTAVILTALREEFLAVHRHLVDARTVTHPRGTAYECGRFTPGESTWEIGIAEVGAGNATAALEADRAIAFFKADLALFVGVAGGVKDVSLGDVVFATRVYGYESGRAELAFRPRPLVARSTYRMENLARVVARGSEWLSRLGAGDESSTPTAWVGPIAAGEKVIASRRSETYKFIKANYGDSLAVEMEGRGFLEAIHANHGVEAGVVRGISDLVSRKRRSDAAGYQHIAACHASAFAFELLARAAQPILARDADPPRQRRALPSSDRKLRQREIALNRLVTEYGLTHGGRVPPEEWKRRRIRELGWQDLFD